MAKDPLIADMSAYPIMTEEIGYPPSPTGTPGPGSAGGAGTSLGQKASQAVADVLGWKLKDGDVKGFLGALTQSFDLVNDEGHTKANWKRRTYASQSDLAGGVTGAQASVYARASDAASQALPLLSGLYALDVEADAQVVQSLMAVIGSQLAELVQELGIAGGPRVTRVDEIFFRLLGKSYPAPKHFPHLSPTDPDLVDGLLGKLRDEMGLWSVVAANPNPLIHFKKVLANTVEEEQDVTNYRILVDYVTSLHVSWQNDRQFFGLNSKTPFFGTQLVLISRQLQVVSDGVDQVRFIMDSVFMPFSERQTMRIDFPPPPADHHHHHPPHRHHPQPMFVEDLLSWVQRFVSEEAPRTIQEGGKFGVENSVMPVVDILLGLVEGAIHPHNIRHLPEGYRTPRVHRAWQDLASQLNELRESCKGIRFTVPTEESEL